jgi:hypothetical protein
MNMQSLAITASVANSIAIFRGKVPNVCLRLVFLKTSQDAIFCWLGVALRVEYRISEPEGITLSVSPDSHAVYVALVPVIVEVFSVVQEIDFHCCAAIFQELSGMFVVFVHFKTLL